MQVWNKNDGKQTMTILLFIIIFILLNIRGIFKSVAYSLLFM